MICGTSNIWPMPTGKVSLSSRSLTFKSNQIQLDMKSEFGEAKQLLSSAYNVFLFDLKTLEERHTHTKTQNVLDKNNNQMKGEKMADGVNGANVAAAPPAAAAAAAGMATARAAPPPADGEADSAKAKVEEKNCDINKIIINAEIEKSGDVFIHMDIDESYELNVTSMFDY